MLEKRFANGKVYTAITNLVPWDKNPRRLESADDLERLKRQIAYLGQYKPSLATQDGIIIGGNMRNKAMSWLNNNVLIVTENGQEKQIDLRGLFNEIWITELSFGQTELTHEQIQAGEKPKYRAIIDGQVQDREYESIEQIMIEYALSDNDAIGVNDKQALAELVTPFLPLMPANQYKLETAPAVELKSYLQSPDKKPKKAQPQTPGYHIVIDAENPEQQAQVLQQIQDLGLKAKAVTT